MSAPVEWRVMSCGCCAGIMWGGEYPRTCPECDGGGSLFVTPSGRLALYPGGPFRGSDPDAYAKAQPLARDALERRS